jgi:hypothetical protein
MFSLISLPVPSQQMTMFFMAGGLKTSLRCLLDETGQELGFFEN